MEVSDNQSRWFRSTIDGMKREFEASKRYDETHRDNSSPHAPHMGLRIRIHETLCNFQEFVAERKEYFDSQKKLFRLQIKELWHKNFDDIMRYVCSPVSHW